LRDYYAALGVAPDADHEVIKAAFRALAKKYHPDTAADPVAANARFREINEAHSVLSNPEARAEYDRPLSPHRQEPFVTKSPDSAIPEEGSEATLRQGASVAGKVRYGAAAFFVFGFVPAVALFICLLVGLAIIELALGR
jgi:curved DNA-binding protein CbpA